MIIVLLAEGFEEIEALTPVDILRREGFDVKTVGISGRTVTGSHGIAVVADALPEEIDLSMVEMAVFPGGMPGSLNLDASDYTDKVIAEVYEKGGRIAAICAAPLVFGRRGLLSGKRATCFSGFEGELSGATVTGEDFVTDGNITTGKGMTVSLEFARELVRVLKIKDLSEEKRAILSDKGLISAIEVVISAKAASTSLLQRKLSIGYGKAASYIDKMEKYGIISGACGCSPRKVLITEEEWSAMRKA